MKGSIYSVTDITVYIKRLVSQDFLLSDVRVEGELSNVKYHSSGHIYFTIKDAGAALSCVMFARDAYGLTFRLEDGQKIVAAGRIDVYQQTGRYQLYVSSVKMSGLGNLYAEYERLKEELFQMGMFDEMYKRPIPKLVRRLGVVTSKTGAVRRDIEQVALRRNPYVQIILCPVAVQGESAKEQIARGIRRIEKENVDVIIIGRGGGSIEDLWAFNTREVAQAVFDCETPIISAVGHQTDTTIADLVADLRAPTPSAAAELAVADITELTGRIDQAGQQLTRLMLSKTAHLKALTGKRAAELRYASPRLRITRYAAGIEEKKQALCNVMDGIIREKREDLDKDRLSRIMKDRINGCRNALMLKASGLDKLSPVKRIASGYAYVEKADGGHVRSALSLKKGDALKLHFADGIVNAVVENVDGHEKI